MRNIGSAAGISITSAILVRGGQINHGYLSEYMTPFSHLPLPGGLSGTAGLEMLNAGITRQAMMISYINVFMMLSVLCLMIIPVVIFLNVPKLPMTGEPMVVGE